jgi:hypothetical protein
MMIKWKPNVNRPGVQMVNYAMEVGDGKIKTFPLRGIKDDPPYLHDQRFADAGRHGRVLQPGAR